MLTHHPWTVHPKRAKRRGISKQCMRYLTFVDFSPFGRRSSIRYDTNAKFYMFGATAILFLKFDPDAVSLFSIEPIDIHHLFRNSPLDLLLQARYKSY